jgi:hypothetical protein
VQKCWWIVVVFIYRIALGFYQIMFHTSFFVFQSNYMFCIRDLSVLGLCDSIGNSRVYHTEEFFLRSGNQNLIVFKYKLVKQSSQSNVTITILCLNQGRG